MTLQRVIASTPWRHTNGTYPCADLPQLRDTTFRRPETLPTHATDKTW